MDTLIENDEENIKIVIIVEGKSDKLIFDYQEKYFSKYGLDVSVKNGNSRTEVINKAKSHYTVAKINKNDYIIFAIDKDKDGCFSNIRRVIEEEINSIANSHCQYEINFFVMELEAWYLADYRCLNSILDNVDRPSGITDDIKYPKQKLFSLWNNSKGYKPTTVECASAFGPNLDLEEASKYNNSCKRFLRIIKDISNK